MDRTINRSAADQVESRGSQRARRESPVSARRTPPVQSRSEIGIQAPPLEGRPALRRRVDLPLSTPGAEIRLPAVPVVSNKWRILSGMLTISLLVGLILLTQSGLFKVSELTMEGLERYTTGEISQAINITGSSIFFINPERVKEDLTLTYPGLSEVDVKVGWPAHVTISLRERTPVLAWNWDGHVRWVDLNGVAFEPQSQDVKVIQVNSDILPPTVQDRFVDPALVDTVAVLAAYLPQDTALHYDQEHGLGWHDSRGWDVYFGLHTKDPEQKMNIYLSLVDYLEGKRITPRVIDVEYMDSPYFRMEE